MRRTGIRAISRTVALSCCVVIIAALTFTAAHAAPVDCSFHAPATVGSAGLVVLPGDDLLSPDAADLVASAGCSTEFTCNGCGLSGDFSFSGVGLIAGEVTVTVFSFFEGMYEVTLATCGPTPGTGCSGGFDTDGALPFSAFPYQLNCRAHGVVAVLVGGFCLAETS